MTRDEARGVLTIYRPWTDDAAAPEIAEALAWTRKDAELGRWFAQHCANQMALRAAFQNITPPPGLKEQILSEHTARLKAGSRKRAQFIAAMAIATLIFGIALGWLIQHQATARETSFAAYRSRMVRTALKSYGMDLETNSAPAIRAFLAQHQAHADYVLPAALAAATNTGCGVLRWQGHPVTMVCFRSGRPLRAGEKTDLFLFVLDRRAAPDAPKSAAPQFTQVNQLVTAAWTQDEKVYVLAAPGDEEFLKRYL